MEEDATANEMLMVDMEQEGYNKILEAKLVTAKGESEWQKDQKELEKNFNLGFKASAELRTGLD